MGINANIACHLKHQKGSSKFHQICCLEITTLAIYIFSLVNLVT